VAEWNGMQLSVTADGRSEIPGTWTQIKNFPNFNVSMALLLTDGNVLCQASQSNEWWRLVPHATGGYANGTWQPRADSFHAPLYYASAVLANGLVFIAGGEYDFGREVDLCAAALYDPVKDTWQQIATPPGWTQIGDAPCCVLEDGRVLLWAIENSACALYDPATSSWAAAGNKLNINSNEETWTLLRDGSVLTAECNGHPATERYFPNAGWRWKIFTPVDLVEDASIEIGPAVLLPNGRVFAIGATGYTAIFTLDGDPTLPGSWDAGPVFPFNASGQQLGAKDSPACLLPNGRVLCAVGPVDGVKDNYLGPTSFFEYDPNNGVLSSVSAPGNSAGSPSTGILLLLPSAEVMFINGTTDVWFYFPDDQPRPAWAPTITNVAAELVQGKTYRLEGTQLNGLSQACSYGDDAAMATNYPLVRLRLLDSEIVRYCRTFDHSSMGVAPTTPGSTNFEVPKEGLAAGAYQLSVVANGIPSTERAVTVVAAAGA
jgi:hypothetical protein